MSLLSAVSCQQSAGDLPFATTQILPETAKENEFESIEVTQEPQEVLFITPDTPDIISATSVLTSAIASNTPTPTLSPVPFLIQNPSLPCGQSLPLILPNIETNYEWKLPPIADDLVPEQARPAIDYIYSNPNDVSVVVFKVDYEGIGFYHNADSPMPLASVSKLVQLIAWAKGVEAGEFDANQFVSRAELDQWYLPGSDLGAHPDALAEFGGRPLTQDDVAWMMIRHSSNAASDYFQELLGQERIENTVRELGLTDHTAPCSWLGKFLTVSTLNNQEISQLKTDPAAYGAMISDRQDRYLQDNNFQETSIQSWQRRSQPSFESQADFFETFDTKGTARDYSRLMAQLIQDEIGSPATSQLIRSHLEWPIVEFPINQARYSTVGYKNGTLPGILTTLYYAEPYWSDRPIVVALFYRNLPSQTYRRWRREFPHDALAHWLMSNPNGIHIMHVLRDSATE